MSMNILSLSNVILDDDLEKAKETISGVNHLLEPVINRLATLNPLWTFVAYGRMYGSGNGKYQVAQFKVKLDNEELGSIGTSFMGSRGTVISISNDRIGATRSRGSSYRTADADKAILMAKKMFGKMNPTERISKAVDRAEQIISRGAWNKERECSSHRHSIEIELMDWAKKGGFAMFLEYIEHEANPTKRATVTHAREKLEVLEVEMKTIERVQKDFSDKKTALVVKDTGKYLVRIGSKVDLYDDSSLPMDIRMKMGMLKLVNEEQYLTDIGCKVSDEIFVLLMDDLTNVSKGV